MAVVVLPQVFGEVFSRDHQLIRADPRAATYLACGLIARGPTATIADINRNIARIRPQLRMVHWNSEVGTVCVRVCVCASGGGDIPS